MTLDTFACVPLALLVWTAVAPARHVALVYVVQENVKILQMAINALALSLILAEGTFVL